MKQKRSILRVVVLRFIGYSLGTELAVSILEEIFNKLIYGVEREFPYDGLVGITPEMDSRQITLVVLWFVLQMAVYIIGIILFARSISHKVSEPAKQMAEGFKAVSEGNLNVKLSFETETEFKQMRDSFNIMAEKLRDSEEKRKALENERSRLFSNIAHDLKTPITTIMGYSGALADGLVNEPEKQKEYQMAIKAKSVQVNQLIDRLFSYSKLGDKEYQMNLERADLGELLRLSCASMFGEIESKQMELDLRLPEEPVFCLMDSVEINRAVNNLLINAVRHNPVGSLLLVSLREENGNVVIEIADSGEKISEAISKNLFEPFVSGSESRSSGHGTGLGLAIVKKIMERHLGEVILTEADFPYTKMFVLRLPKNNKYE